MNDQHLELVTGRLGRDPYLAYSKKGNPICELSVGLKTEQNLTIWRKVVVFGKLAELCKVHLKKGQEVFVRGPVKLQKFINKEGHEKEYLEINAFQLDNHYFNSDFKGDLMNKNLEIQGNFSGNECYINSGIESENFRSQLFNNLIWGIDEVSRFTSYSKGTIYNLVSEGDIPYRKRRGKLWFIPNEVLKWLKGEL